MKTVAPESLVSAVPLEVKAMTKQEKLAHWADLVRKQPRNVSLVHGIEHWTPELMAASSVIDHYALRFGNGLTAFHIAASDKTFREQGLQGHSANEIMRFFELTRAELHEFSCDCGGMISNNNQACRIERLGEPKESKEQRGMFGRVINAIGF